MRSSASPPVIVSARPESTSSENWSEEGAAGVAVATITVAIMANAVSSRHDLEVIEALTSVSYRAQSESVPPFVRH
jgi:hypothetical protein